MEAGELKKLSNDDYTICCLFCGKSGNNLSMFPHRKNGKVVGFIFSCCEVPENMEFELKQKEDK